VVAPLVEVPTEGPKTFPKTLAIKKRSLRYGQPSLLDNDTARSARNSQNEGTEVSSYIETADAGVYTQVCYYPVTEGSRPVGCVPPVETGPKTRLDLKASLEISTEVWLDPENLSGFNQPRVGNAFSTRTPTSWSHCSVGFPSIGRRRTQVWRDPAHLSRASCLRRGTRLRVRSPQIPKVAG